MQAEFMMMLCAIPEVSDPFVPATSLRERFNLLQTQLCTVDS